MELSKGQVRRFLLLKQGLTGDYRFEGKQGALDYIRQAGCIQFDPVDVCGKNAELVLQSRVKGFTKAMLHKLLYEDRTLVDSFDKNLAIIPTEDWPYFERFRQIAKKNAINYPEMQDLMKQAKECIDKNGACNSGNLPVDLEGEMNWRSAIHWSPGHNTTRAVLEQLYSEGELIIHHKKGTRKFYDIAEKHIPAEIFTAEDPLPDDTEYLKWRMLRRIGAVGLLWNRLSDAWLGIWELNAANRNGCFRLLKEEGKILEVKVEGIKDSLFCRAEDKPLIEKSIFDPEPNPRCEVLAPLDCLIWDRKLIQALFDFDYTWEIYHPAHKRKYGHYVLPMLYGEGFAGRIEATVDRKTKTLNVKHIWYEEGFKQSKAFKKEEDNCINRLAKFNGCTSTHIN